MRSAAFIDASNLFYGGEKSLGWKIDYEKLLGYLREKYGIGEALYFGGIEIQDFEHDYLRNDTVPLTSLEAAILEGAQRLEEKGVNEDDYLEMLKGLGQMRFYRKLESFGYTLCLKPVKTYQRGDGGTVRKANCDVDMAFRLMERTGAFDRAVVMSGDGDFLPVLKHLKEIGKEIIVLARAQRTAREIKQFAGSDFRDFEYLRERIRRA